MLAWLESNLVFIFLCQIGRWYSYSDDSCDSEWSKSNLGDLTRRFSTICFILFSSNSESVIGRKCCWRAFHVLEEVRQNFLQLQVPKHISELHGSRDTIKLAKEFCRIWTKHFNLKIFDVCVSSWMKAEHLQREWHISCYRSAAFFQV